MLFTNLVTFIVTYSLLFQNSPGVKYLYDQGRENLYVLAGKAQFGTGGNLSKSIHQASHRGTSYHGISKKCDHILEILLNDKVEIYIFLV